MKMEHKEAIDRARLHGVMPSVLAHELLVHDLVEAAMFELRNISAPYSKLNQGAQQEVINRITEKVADATSNAVQIISSRSVDTIPLIVADAKFKAKSITVTGVIDAQDPNRHGLIDVAGKLCLLVLAPDDYNEGLDFIQPERDQPDLPLHVSDLTGSLFDGKATGPDEVGYTTDTGTDPMYAGAVAFVLETRRATISAIQRKLGIGYNRAAVLMDAMEREGVVSPIDHTGAREVLLNPRGGEKISLDEDDAGDSQAADDMPDELIDSIANDDKEFGDFSYTDAKQLVILHATDISIAWLQHRFAIDSDKASTLALRLLDDGVTALETEGDSPIDNIYVVTAALSDLKAG